MRDEILQSIRALLQSDATVTREQQQGILKACRDPTSHRRSVSARSGKPLTSCSATPRRCIVTSRAVFCGPSA